MRKGNSSGPQNYEGLYRKMTDSPSRDGHHLTDLVTSRPTGPKPHEAPPAPAVKLAESEPVAKIAPEHRRNYRMGAGAPVVERGNAMLDAAMKRLVG